MYTCVCVLIFMSTKKCGKKRKIHHTYEKQNETHLRTFTPETKWKKCFLNVGFFTVQIQGYHRWRWPRSVQDM